MAQFRGRPACSCLIEWLPAFEAELKRRGVIKNSIDIWQLIGGAKASGGTHSTGGAFDVAQRDATTVKVAREMGAAFWNRPYNWDNRGGMAHGHGVLNGCPHNGPARYQINDLARGLNGLANRAKDTGPAPRNLRTWKDGIKWAKAQAKAAKPVVYRTTEFKVYEQNCKGDTSGFTKRAPKIADRINAHRPHFVSAVELYTLPRIALSRLVKPLYKMQSNHRGKVQYAIKSRNGWAKTKSAKVDLGNGKHAIATRYMHGESRADYVLATAHLSWEHDAAKKRTGEAKKLVAFLKATYPGVPWLITGDMNDSHKATKTRPDDSSGDVFKAAGLHDLQFDVPAKARKNDEYNTANGYKTPAPKAGVHLDRFWGTKEFEGLEWAADVVEGARPADHWGVFMRVSLRHPK